MTVFSPAVAPVLRRLVDTPISLRELEVIDASADGLSYAEVGELLGLSGLTVKARLERLALRLHIRGRAGLVGFCYLRGLFVRGWADPVAVTPRQREVLPLVAAGHTDRRIALLLGVVEDTASVHVTGAMKAHSARTRAHLVRKSIDAGTLPLTVPVRVEEVAA